MTAALVAALIIPLCGAVAVGPWRRSTRLPMLVACGAAALQLIAVIAIPFGAGDGPMWHRLELPWAPAIGLSFDLGVDGISYPLIVLTSVLTLLCCAYTAARPPGWGGPQLAALLLLVDFGISGVFMATNLVLFFVFFEVVLLPMYAIIRGWGGADRAKAATKFVLYTLLGSLLLLVGVLIVVAEAGSGDIVAIAQGRHRIPAEAQLWAFIFLALGLAIKSPLWPLHTWLPDAHTQAPTVGSVMLAGVLLKLGTYGLIRVGVMLVPQGAKQASAVLAVLAVTAVIVGSLVCLAQTELKRLIAYSSVSHMGFVLLGIATMTPNGITAALYGSIAHGLITGLLFFLVGTIKDRTGTGELARLSGLRDTMPRLSGVLTFAALASAGLPGLAGFWGEAFAIYAAFERGGTLWVSLAVVAAVAAVLSAVYLLRMIREVTTGEPSAAARITDSGPASRDVLVWAPMSAAIVVLGLAPWLLAHTIANSQLGWGMLL